MSNVIADPQKSDKPSFLAEKIYIKETSLESSNSLDAFLGTDAPDQSVSLEYTIETERLPDDHYEVVLNLKISSKNNGTPLYTIEAKQAGIFLIRNLNNPERVERFLNVRCPRILLPYARETISNLAVKAGFPPLVITPMDFFTRYEETRSSGLPGQPTAS